MSETPSPADQVNRALRGVQRSVLATLGVCALAILLMTAGRGEAEAREPERWLTELAVGLGAGSILTRYVAVTRREARLRIHLAWISPVLAGAVGVVGVVVAAQDGPRNAALLFALGGAILALRPPVRVVSP